MRQGEGFNVLLGQISTHRHGATQFAIHLQYQFNFITHQGPRIGLRPRGIE